jgi:3-dehydrotetronate 4-kinase
MPLLFGAIADDFTGGLELASVLVRAGIRTRMLTRFADAEELSDVEAVVVGLKTRVAPKDRAVRAFAQAVDLLTTAEVRQLFFKYCATFDSTRHGNIGPCADLLADRRAADFTAFCPAFPEVKRTVFQGHLFAFDQIISESPKRLDPLTPMRDPNLVRVLQQQTPHRVGLIRHEDFKAGSDAVRARIETLKKDGIRYAIADGADEDDLRMLAAASVDWQLMTGGSSVAVYYPDLWRESGLVGGHSSSLLPKVDGHAAVLAGSCAERTAEQLEHFGLRRPVLRLDLAAVAGDPAAADKAIAWAAERIASGPIAITTAARPEAVAAIQARFGRRRAARMAEQLLGRIAVGLRELGVRRFVIAGGETSGAVVEALRIRALAVGSYEAPGQSKAVAITEQPLSFYLKSGKLGPVDMFERVLAETTSASSA